MKRLLLFALALAYCLLVAGDFISDPGLLFLPASLAVSALILLGIPWLVRARLHPEPFKIPPAMAVSTLLAALVLALFVYATPGSLETFAFVNLVSLNAVFYLLCTVILIKEDADQPSNA